MRRFALLLLLLIATLVGCATTDKLMKLNLDMTKAEVINAIGEPTTARGSIRNKYDQVIEVWEYKLVKRGDEFNERYTYYWLYFNNGRLDRWGEAGDWKHETDRIYEMQFR